MKRPVRDKIILHELIKTRAGDESLRPLYAFQQIILSVPVQLRQHVIQKKYRMIMYSFFYQLDFRQLQRQGSRPLLSLGSVSSEIHCICLNTEIIAVWTGRRRFHFFIRIPVLDYLL